MPKRTYSETRHYPFLILADEEVGGFSALSQFGGTQGETIQEAAEMAKQSLVDLAAAGEELDPPISDEELIADNQEFLEPGHAPRIWMIEYRFTTAAERITLSVPQDVAANLKRQGNASQYVAALVRNDVGGMAAAKS